MIHFASSLAFDIIFCDEEFDFYRNIAVDFLPIRPQETFDYDTHRDPNWFLSASQHLSL